jgi:hypothetical protein
MYTSLLQMLQQKPYNDGSGDADDDQDPPTHDQPKRKRVIENQPKTLVPEDYTPQAYPNYTVSIKRLFEVLNSPEYLKATTKVSDLI